MGDALIVDSSNRGILAWSYIFARAPWLETRAAPLNLLARIAVLPRLTGERVLRLIDDSTDERGADPNGQQAYLADLVPEIAAAITSANSMRRYDVCKEIHERLEFHDQLVEDGPPAGDGLPDWLFVALSTERISIDSYVPCPTRRNGASMDALRALIYRIVDRDKPMSVRQVFYRLVAAGAIEKSETEYKRTVGRLLTEMRLAGILPFEWLSDATRWQRKPVSFESMTDAVRKTAEFYRQAIWRQLPDYVEIWLEKEALAGVLFDVTGEFDVPLMVCRGYSSLTFLHSAAEAIATTGKRTFIYYFGDHDPSGKDISANVERRLHEFAPGSEIYFERVAVTPEQIAVWNLPSRPTKQTDSRAADFEGESTEVDAIEPDALRELCRQCIARHIPPGYMDSIEAAEKSERDIGMRLAGAA